MEYYIYWDIAYNVILYIYWDIAYNGILHILGYSL